MNKKIYVLSGLGADQTLFSKLVLDDWQMQYLPWLNPHKNEDIVDYARRMAEQITNEDPIILAHSFASLIAIEIAKIKPVKKIIVVSGLKTKNDIPPFMVTAGKIGLHKMAIKPFFKVGSEQMYHVMGVHTDADKALLDRIMSVADLDFYNWAFDKIVYWQNEDVPANLVHIHGTYDRLFSGKFIESFIPVENGGQYMLYNRAEELSPMILEALKEFE